MSIQPPILRFAILAWCGLELALALYNGVARRKNTVRDAGSKAFLIMAIAVGFWLAFRLRSVPATRMDDLGSWPTYLAVLLFVIGLAIRMLAVLTLGRFFTTTVTIRAEHRLVRRGLYGRIRHPGYLGSLLIFSGLGFSFQNWLSAAALIALSVGGFLYRIHVEERVLAATFGREYDEYARETKRLVPGVY